MQAFAPGRVVPAEQCRRYVVRGRVQGVWFRAGTREQAERLGLRGWVRNRRDGSVEAAAAGPAEALERFEAWLRQGPERAEVQAVEVGPYETDSRSGASSSGASSSGAGAAPALPGAGFVIR